MAESKSTRADNKAERPKANGQPKSPLQLISYMPGGRLWKEAA